MGQHPAGHKVPPMQHCPSERAKRPKTARSVFISSGQVLLVRRLCPQIGKDNACFCSNVQWDRDTPRSIVACWLFKRLFICCWYIIHSCLFIHLNSWCQQILKIFQIICVKGIKNLINSDAICECLIKIIQQRKTFYWCLYSQLLVEQQNNIR